MKTEQPILITSILATGEEGATIPKNAMVNFNGALLGNAAKQFGVCNADTLVGEQMPVTVAGIVLIRTDAAISKGSQLMCSDDGRVRPWETGGELIGYALDASIGADELIRILLN